MDAAAIRGALGRAARPGPPRLEVLGPGPGTGSVLGLVPGSFDPMTIAHTALVEALAADAVLLVYSPATLSKEPGPGGSPRQPLLLPEERVGSLLAYAAARPDVSVALSSHGLYVDQVEAAADAFPGSRLVLGLGSDKVIQLLDPSWYEDRDAALERLLARTEIAYALRRGDEERLTRALVAHPRWAGRLTRLSLAPDLASVSSRAIREALRRGDDVTAFVPREVLPFLTR